MGKAVLGRDALIGQVVGGRYEIVRLIGRGGMGAIYEVRNTRLGRAFAMKTLIGEAADDVEVLARFRREADVIARIKHPHIVEVIDWEALDDGSPCMVLEYLQGEDLSHRIREGGPMTWHAIAKIGDQVASALSVAHAANVVHRDLKPQNIFLANDDSGEERAKLLDFGVSKIRDSHSLVTTDARLIGTPSYMSPEQAEGRHDDVGPATDLWALGAILYEMATGKLAFDGASMPAVLYKICSRDAEPVDRLRPDAPPAFVALVRDMLARDLSARICDADVFRIRLREALSDVAPGVRYSDQVIAARGSRTSLPPATGSTTNPRRKRQTGAHDATISTGPVAIAQTVQSGTFPVPQPPPGSTPVASGQVSASTLPARPRRTGLVLAISGLAALTVAVAIVVAATRSDDRPPPTPAASRPQPLVAPPPPPAIDAAAAVQVEPPPIDAAVAEPIVPAPKPSRAKPRPRPAPTPAKVEPPVVEPPKPEAPKKQPCKKDDVQCLYGDGT
ncbi:MAG TPA: serine/threonine-protein kinase [Kofleriaceae bacterium]|nr:serine/threonine-protein kinase [Kofleriaceae bacterium]